MRDFGFQRHDRDHGAGESINPPFALSGPHRLTAAAASKNSSWANSVPQAYFFPFGALASVAVFICVVNEDVPPAAFAALSFFGLRVSLLLFI
jgi:hypothetical protein